MTSSSSAFAHVVDVSDMRRLAQRRVPKAVFDYLDGGAEDELTLRENRRAFDHVILRPRCAVALPQCDLRTTVLGMTVSFPALLAPVGYSAVMNPDGESGAARAAGAAGTAYILSTISGHKMEDVKAATTGAAWYQLYLLGGREVAEAALERARRAGFSALVVTIDTAVAGMRERDLRNGLPQMLGSNLVAKIPYVWQYVFRPRWLAGFLVHGGTPRLENVVLPGSGPMALLDVGKALAAAAVTWSDLRWVRQSWPGPIVIKGVHVGDDARRAVDEGAAAVVVSNHGGRQLDGVAASLQALPEVVKAVDGRIEVLMDGGVRRGSHIVKAICMGARAVLIGRAYAYGLAAGGTAGVARCLEILRADFERTMRLLGCASVAELDRRFVTFPADWSSATGMSASRGYWGFQAAARAVSQGQV